MALIKCPECGKDVSTSAECCPNCGYPLKKTVSAQQPIQYETKAETIRCLGRSQNALNRELEPYTSSGWEVVSIVEDQWRGGLLSPVYKVILRRPVSTTTTVKCGSCKHIFKIDKSAVTFICPNCGVKLSLNKKK